MRGQVQGCMERIDSGWKRTSDFCICIMVIMAREEGFYGYALRRLYKNAWFDFWLPYRAAPYNRTRGSRRAL